MSWTQIDSPNFIPSELQAVGEAAVSITELTEKLLTTVSRALEVSSRLAEAADSNPTEKLLAKAVDQLDGLLEQLTTFPSAHAIFVPIQRQHYGRGVDIPEDRIPPEDRVNLPIDSDTHKAWDDFVSSADAATGGTRGFWKALGTSLRDEGDLARPQFPEEYAVTGTVLLFGSHSLKELRAAVEALSTLFAFTQGRTDPLDNTTPVVKEPEARVYLLSNDPPARLAVLLEWEAVPPLINTPLHGEEVMRVDEVLIVRSTDPTFREQFRWSDVFPDQPESRNLPESGKTKVIARVPNDGFIRQYVDDSSDLEEGVTYYYAMIPRVTVEGEAQAMGTFSAVRSVVYGTTVPTKRSEAPDWVSTNSLSELVPPIDGLVSQVRLAVQGLRRRTVANSGSSSLIRSTIHQLEKEISELEELNETIARGLAHARALANTPTVQMHTTTIAVRSGGIDEWMMALAQRLSDPDDDSRPQYSDGDLVSGIVIVSGAPNLGQLTEFTATMQLLFGRAVRNNPIRRAVEAITRSSREAPVTPTTTTATRTAFNESLEVVDSTKANC